jgi:hypothetical protein
MLAAVGSQSRKAGRTSVTPAAPRFTVQALEYCSPQSIEFVRARLRGRE